MPVIWNLPRIDHLPFTTIEERRPVLLITSAPAWNAVKDRLRGLNIAAQVEVTEANTDHWERKLLAIKDQPSEQVYAIGGGLVVDAAKYMAVKLDLPLACLPTALSVDAFLTWASGVRRDGCVTYIETKPPDQLLIDFEVIACAPESIRAAGITDVLSIATGSWDWKFAEEQGNNPAGMDFIPWVYETAQSILSGALDCAEAAGRGDRAGLKSLLDCLCMEVQLCNQVGHARPEEGSEHYFAYLAENFTGHGLPHGDLVGPGILIFARLQGQETARLKAALQACHIPLEGISEDIVERTLMELPSFCRKHGLAFGLAHTLKTP